MQKRVRPWLPGSGGLGDMAVGVDPYPPSSILPHARPHPFHTTLHLPICPALALPCLLQPSPPSGKLCHRSAETHAQQHTSVANKRPEVPLYQQDGGGRVPGRRAPMRTHSSAAVSTEADAMLNDAAPPLCCNGDL